MMMMMMVMMVMVMVVVMVCDYDDLVMVMVVQLIVIQPFHNKLQRYPRQLQARDLSTNFMAAEDPSKSTSGGGGGPSTPGEDENKQNPAEAPRPKGAPNRFL